jgi:Rrf2 family transcriptional regulator, nitric oxide-sensitive transcriptional repressor
MAGAAKQSNVQKFQNSSKVRLPRFQPVRTTKLVFYIPVMRLSVHTDYGLRFLTYAALVDPRAVSVKEVSERFGVSAHHMMKVAQSLAKAGMISPVRGRLGGFRLAKPASEVRVGDVVRNLEGAFELVECMRAVGANCPIIPACTLPRLLREASEAFLGVLDTRTLDELVHRRADLIPLLERAS